MLREHMSRLTESKMTWQHEGVGVDEAEVGDEDDDVKDGSWISWSMDCNNNRLSDDVSWISIQVRHLHHKVSQNVCLIFLVLD